MASDCRSANCKMTKWKIVAICGTVLLIAAAVVVALYARRRPAPPPDASAAQTPALVRVKAVERKAETVERENVTASGAIAIVCGEDAATAGRYEARNEYYGVRPSSDPFAPLAVFFRDVDDSRSWQTSSRGVRGTALSRELSD